MPNSAAIRAEPAGIVDRHVGPILLFQSGDLLAVIVQVCEAAIQIKRAHDGVSTARRGREYTACWRQHPAWQPAHRRDEVASTRVCPGLLL